MTGKPQAENQEIVETGRRVLQTEGLALCSFAEGLGDNFACAVNLMLEARGRIVVSGMGKSGHVARKIAATLASTGSPSQFVHPAEASHGDLGMVTRDDVVLVLSNSGETPELADVIAHTRRFSISMIGVASNAGSTLLRQSDVALVLPNAPEACSVGLAPTTSTTLTLALGDALAVALMERRKFTPENFRSFHPGGQLGARLASVANLMHSGDDLPLVDAGAPMAEALLVISQKSFGVVGVTDTGGNLIGIITDGDLRRRMDGLLDQVAGEVMTAGPKTVSTESLAIEALGLMHENRITSLFAMAPGGSGRPAGILHIHDCLRAGLE